MLAQDAYTFMRGRVLHYRRCKLQLRKIRPSGQASLPWISSCTFVHTCVLLAMDARPTQYEDHDDVETNHTVVCIVHPADSGHWLWRERRGWN